MKDVTGRIDAFLDEVKSYAERIDSEVADRENDFRSMCIWNIYNRAMVTKEIISFYKSSWSRIEVPLELESELNERIMIITKNLYADTVSSIEKAVKDCTSVYKESKLREKSLEGNKNYLYLRNIINASADLGYITYETYRDWEELLIMRNLVTHNNCVSDRKGVFELDDISIIMRPNRMMKGPPETFVCMTSRITSLFVEWLVTMDRLFK